MTVADELRRAGLLEAIGGPATLVTLQTATPATSNAGRYAKIIEEHALLRRLIRVAGDIAEMGYDLPDDVTKVVDMAESMVFEVAQRRVTDTMDEIHNLLDANLDRLEQLYERGQSITGLPSGFADLDELLSGLQPNALLVLGARPSAGKTALALGIATHAALEAQRPVLLFSLEMSKLELTQRMLCSEARVDSKRVRNGNLNEADWQKIAHATGRLAEAPIWIDDNPNLTIMEIRSKARRLKARTGDLGLVVVDYLQLMTGRSSAENRQVEVSEISRGLKILARELECPVLALSQLSRGLEMRQDKRPMLADLRESGCLTADTRITRADNGRQVTMGELLASGEEHVPVWTLNENYRLVRGEMTKVFPSGVKTVYELTLVVGSVGEGQRQPSVPGPRRLVPAREARRGRLHRRAPRRALARVRRASTRSATTPCRASCGATSASACPTTASPWPMSRRGLKVDDFVDSFYANPLNRAQIAELARVVPDPLLADLARSDVRWDTIVSITELGDEEVFDATVPGTHNFVADGIVVHNSIEQDADVVMFIYRDEVYNPDSPDRGTAEILVSQAPQRPHRHDPPGLPRPLRQVRQHGQGRLANARRGPGRPPVGVRTGPGVSDGISKATSST